MLKKIIIAVGFSFMIASSANAALKSYDISWIGANNYSLSGKFTFDDETAGTDVDQTELTYFFIEGFLNGNSLGTYSGPVKNFNFNTVTGKLGGGYQGASNSTDGQSWNEPANVYPTPPTNGVGFGSGLYRQLLSSNGEVFYDSSLFLDQYDSGLTATPSAVPLPAAAWMFIAGLAALFGGKWRLKRKVGLKVGLAA